MCSAKEAIYPGSIVHTSLRQILNTMVGFLSVSILFSVCSLTSAEEMLSLTARRHIETSKGSGKFRIVEEKIRWEPHRTAIIICDMWNAHWCKGATGRVAEMAPRMNEVVQAARQRGVLIIHAPSDTMEYYKDWPQRKLAAEAPDANPPESVKAWSKHDPSREGPFPIDDSDEGCDCDPPCVEGHPWHHQIDTIEIEQGDAITDQGVEAYNLMAQKGIDNLIVMGVHANMCVLGRSFSIRSMVGAGKSVLLMRDLTDTMYNPRMAPYVSHFRGTELVVDHIEKYWCPTVTSTDFTGKPAFSFAKDKRPHIVFVIHEPEYDTKFTLPAFAEEELQGRFGWRCTFVHGDGPNNIPGLEALRRADLLVLSVWRQALPPEQLECIRAYVNAGKPLVAIRTSSHAFVLRDGETVEGRVQWPEFDPEVLGGNYKGHHGNKSVEQAGDPKTYVWVLEEAGSHPILSGIARGEFVVPSWLYKVSPLAESATPLMMGRVEGRTPYEPVAWTNTYNGGRVFYTSLGHPGDFQIPAFRRLLLNAVIWAFGESVPRAVEIEMQAAVPK